MLKSKKTKPVFPNFEYVGGIVNLFLASHEHEAQGKLVMWLQFGRPPSLSSRSFCPGAVASDRAAVVVETQPSS